MNPGLSVSRVESPQDYYAIAAQGLFNSEETFYRPAINWDEGYRLYVAQNDLLFAGATNVRVDPNRDYAFIAKLAVEESYRGHGIGSALVRCAINAAAEAGCELIAINATNANNERLYRRLGFDNNRARDSHRLFLDIGSTTTA